MVEEEEEEEEVVVVGAESSWIEKLHANPKANVFLLVHEIGDTLPTTNRKKKAIMRGGGTNSLLGIPSVPHPQEQDGQTDQLVESL